MRRSLQVLMALVIAASTASAHSCAAGRCARLDEITYKIVRDDDVAKGKETVVTLTIINKSDEFIIVDQVKEGQISQAAPDSLVEERPGTIEAVAGADAFIHNAAAAGTTPAVFLTAIIPPGQRVSVAVPLVPQKDESAFVVRYTSMTLEELAAHFYFKGSESTSGITYSRLDAGAISAAAGKTTGDGNPDALFHDALVKQDLLKRIGVCKMELPYKFNTSFQQIRRAAILAECRQ